MFDIKQRLKGNEFIRNAYIKANRLKFTALYSVSPVLASKQLYRKNTGKKLNLKNPQDFNEKLQWLKLYWQNPLIAKCADKYEVRDYVKECGCEEILNELYGVYNHSSEIDWNNIPGKFALKCTHGCGFNIICDDKEKLDKEQTLKKLNKWLKIRYDRHAAEVHYAKMKPRIICERYIETEAGLLPNDYKVYCFNGKPELILVHSDRENEHKRLAMDLRWNVLDIFNDRTPVADTIRKPDCFNKMLEYAEKLSKPFPFVRVDFYDYNGQPILGELTFTPSGCIVPYFNDMVLERLGNMIQLPEKKGPGA